MGEPFRRILAVAHKEFIHVARDPRALLITLVMPIFMLLLLGYSSSLDVKGMPLAIYDKDGSSESRALAEAYRATGSFTLGYFPQTEAQLRRMMDSGAVQVGLIIPPDYAANLAANHPAEIGCVVDGSNPTIGKQLLAIVTMVGQAHGIQVVQQKMGSAAPQLPGIDTRMRILYNPNLDNIEFMVPAMIGMILQMICSNMTAAAIVRERERGTMEQLIITPVRSAELILGKATPYMAIAILNAAEIIVIGVVLFHIKIHGSMLLLVGFCLMFMFTSLAWGLLVSVIARTRQQAQVLNMLILLPSYMLAGTLWPRSAMPVVLQYIGAAMPLTYFAEMVRGVILKGVGLSVLGVDLGVLTVIGLLLVTLTVSRFRKRLE